jgi:hypothetical protein
MADVGNVNAPMGFQPVCHANGNRYVGKGNRYYKGTAANTRICKGDRVVITTCTDPNGFPEIIKATSAASACTGVVVGFEVTPSNLHKLCYEATDTGYLMVEDDPSVLYRIQEDSVGGALTVAAVDDYIDPITNLDGDAQTGLSKLQLDSSTIGSGSSCRIARLDNGSQNAVGDYAKWLVQMNLSTEVNDSASNLTDI